MPPLPRGVVRVVSDYRRESEPPRQDDAPIVAVARPQGGVFTRPQAMDPGGLTAAQFDNRVRTGRFFRVLRGVYALSPVITPHGARMAAILASCDGASIADLSAGDLWGFAVHDGGPHHVIVPAGGGRGVEGVATHRTRGLIAGDVVRFGGLPVTSPARTLLDLALRLDVTTLRAVIKEAQYARLIDPDALAAAIAAHPGHRGARALRLADPGLRAFAGTESSLEDELFAVLERHGVPLPEPQVWLTGASGQRYRLDGFYGFAMLAIEADGRTAHARAMAFEDDRDRDTDLAAVGVLTLRFTRVQIRTAGATMASRVMAVLARRGSGFQR